MANGRKLNEVTNVSTLASSDRLVSVRTSDGKTVQISLTDFMNSLISGGTWTPSLGFATGDAVLSESIGRWMRMGNFVYITIRAVVDDMSGATGNNRGFTIPSGIPLPADVTLAAVSMVNIASNIPSINFFSEFQSGYYRAALRYTRGTDGAMQQITANDLKAGSVIMLSGGYIIN